MSVARIASRYAKTIIDLAVEAGKVETIFEDIRSVELVSKNKEFALLLQSPIIHSSKKISIFKAIFKDNLDKLTQSFFELIIKKGREGYIPEICSAFYEQYNVLKEMSEVKIISANTLERAEVDAIKDQLLSTKITRKNLNITEVVDSELIGGFVIEVGDLRIDNSIQGKLKRMRKHVIKN